MPTLDVKVTASNFRDDRNEIEKTVQRDDTELTIPDETPLHVPPVQTPTAATRRITRKIPRNDYSGVTEIREMTKFLSDNLALQSKNDQKHFYVWQQSIFNVTCAIFRCDVTRQYVRVVFLILI